MSSKLLDPKSSVGSRSELDLFSLPMTQVGVEKANWIEVQLKNSLGLGDSPFEFHISPMPQMLQLSKNYIVFEARITEEDGTPINQNAANPAVYVGVINLLGKTFFKQVKVYLNGMEIFDSGPDYAFRTYLETELQYGWDAKNSFLEAAGYGKDVLSTSNTVDYKVNSGLVKRSALWQNGSYVQLVAPLHIDLFQQDKFLLSNTDLRLVLERNSDAFCLLDYDATGNNYKIQLRSMKLLVKTVETLKAVSLSIEKTLQTHSAKYPLRRVDVRTIPIAAAQLQSPENSLYTGIVPRRLLIGCVAADAYHGRMSKSPFVFEHFNITEILINAGGTVYPARRMNLKYSDNLYTTAFVNLFENLGLAGEDHGNGIGINDYKHAWNLYAFNLSTTDDDDGAWTIPKTGSTSIQINFDKATTKPIICIVLGEFDGLLTIDQYRNCTLDHRVC